MVRAGRKGKWHANPFDLFRIQEDDITAEQLLTLKRQIHSMKDSEKDFLTTVTGQCEGYVDVSKGMFRLEGEVQVDGDLMNIMVVVTAKSSLGLISAKEFAVLLTLEDPSGHKKYALQIVNSPAYVDTKELGRKRLRVRITPLDVTYKAAVAHLYRMLSATEMRSAGHEVPENTPSESEDSISSLKKQLESAQRQLADVKKRHAEEVKLLRIQLDAKDIFISSLKSDVLELKAEHAKYLTEKKHHKAEVKNLRQELDNEKKEAKSWQEKANANAQHTDALQSQLSSLQNRASNPYMFNCCRCLFAPDKNFDFRGVSDAGKAYLRGGIRYIRPIGSYRYALEVSGRYDEDADKWLESRRGWAVAYHGTTYAAVESIIRNGFHVSKGLRFTYGKGIYCTPCPETAKRFSTPYRDKGRVSRLVLQVRVDPSMLHIVKRTEPERGEYWLVQHTSCIRPYAVCVYTE